jgi:hypothetical protein
VRRSDLLSWRLHSAGNTTDSFPLVPLSHAPLDDILGESAAPLQERISLLALELERGRLSSPGGAAWDLETLNVVLLLLAHLSLLSWGQEVGVVGGGGEGRICDDLDVLAF